MIRHYIKIALRNLWKYKTQSAISIIGLAVGFTCFALSALWIRYEMNYDSFQKNAKDTYAIVLPSSLAINGLTLQVPYPFADYLKKTFPEVKEAVNINESYFTSIKVNDVEHKVNLLRADSGILNIMDIHLIEGHFPEPDKNELAITKEKAVLFFGEENPIGRTINNYADYTITAIVSSYSLHSNFPFDIIFPIKPDEQWNTTSNHGLVLLYPGVDAEAFKQKLEGHEISQGGEHPIKWTNTTLIPLTKLHYEDPLLKRSVKFEYIGLFGLVGVLVILCSLFNYITMFVTRFRIRIKEFALRLVCGGSRGSLIVLLSLEYLISLFLASILGFLLVKILLPFFGELSEIQMALSGIFGELFVYFLGMLFLSLIAFWITIAIFGKHSLQVTIQKRNKQLFRKFSIVVQLFITIGMIFCSLVMIKQMHYLHNSTNIGFEYKDRASVFFYGEQFTFLKDKIKQLPEVEEVLIGYTPLLPIQGAASAGFSTWDDKPEGNDGIILQQFAISDEYIRFYAIQILEGEAIGSEDSPQDIMINESALKTFGWNGPIGKHIKGYGGDLRIKGVLKNIYNLSSTIEVKPFYYVSPNESMARSDRNIIFKFKKDSWKTVQDKINQIVEEEIPGQTIQIYNTEEEYDKLFKSESALILILNFVSGVCVLISIFGFFSLVSLNLEERRKEMAIRKVNGATSGNIMHMYFNEYFLLLFISSLIAFPVAYVIMKHWLEQYIHQTEISAWIYVVILLVIALIITLCTGWRIWQSSRENPSETLKMN